MPEHELPTALPARDMVLESDPPSAEVSLPEAPGRLRASRSRPRVLRRHVKILFISSQSSGGPPLALNEEYRRIERRLESSRFRDAFVLVPALAVRIEELQRALLKHRPDVVHFACHGSDHSALVLLGNDGTPTHVSADALASYFRILRDNVALVVLNACFAAEQASAIRESVGLAIGIRERIADDAAIVFSVALYESLAFGRTVRDSFELALTAIVASGSAQATAPQLFEGVGIDARAVCLVGERPPWPRKTILIGGLVAALIAGALVWKQLVSLRERPTEGPAAIVDLPDMACFRGARIRAGVFDISQRPMQCATLKSSDDCALPGGKGEVPEIVLEDFCLDRYEVTNSQLATWLATTAQAWRFNNTDPAVIQTRVEPAVFLVRTGDECGLMIESSRVRPGPERAYQPATCMTWMAARDYCRAHSKRLPFELEWEFAAKGPEGRPFPWGTSVPKHGAVAFDLGNSTNRHPVDVGSSRQDVSSQHVYDLGGNVAEWVMDGRGFVHAATIRGGSWNSRDPCSLLGSSCKRIEAENFARDVGFRCAKDMEAKE
jgi:formylglycine-generating enzyme required for sulfatase activity